MKAALVAAERGHQVTLVEKKGELGGQLVFADQVAFKYDLKAFKEYLLRQMTNSTIKVMLNTAATLEFLRAEAADAVIAALGAAPIIPPIPGIDGKAVLLATDVHCKPDMIGEKVVVVGGGQVGCEIGLYLAECGKEVVLLEMAQELAKDAMYHYRLPLLEKLAEKLQAITLACCTEILAQGVKYVDCCGEEKALEAQTVVIAAGMKARADEAETMRDAAVEFIAVGDCVQAKNVKMAMRTAFDAASQL
jgi:pyruvate/2-oxoglutarate dehydrogenase complex dihydrolipoamide dehydrogenase (E3) component